MIKKVWMEIRILFSKGKNEIVYRSKVGKRRWK